MSLSNESETAHVDIEYVSITFNSYYGYISEKNFLFYILKPLTYKKQIDKNQHAISLYFICQSLKK